MYSKSFKHKPVCPNQLDLIIQEGNPDKCEEMGQMKRRLAIIHLDKSKRRGKKLQQRIDFQSIFLATPLLYVVKGKI